MKLPHWNRARDGLDRLLSSPLFSARQIYRMAIPLVLDGLSVVFINMLITALISSSGETSVAAVNLVSPVTTLAICVLNGVCTGGTVTVAQCFGSGSTQKTQHAAGQILWLTLLCGSAVGLVMLLLPRPILTLLYAGAEAQVLEKAIRYMALSSFSLILYSIYYAAFSILRGLGESKRCLFLSVIINVAYLLFSVLFINFLQMDIYGSALALTLARLVGALAALAFVFLPAGLPLHMKLRSVFCFDPSVFSSILEVSIPYSIEQIFLYGGNIVITAIAVPLGTSAIAANSIANSLFGLITFTAAAAGNLAVTVTGRCIGAGEKEHAYRYGILMMGFALFLLCVSSLVFYPLFPVMLRRLYAVSPSLQASVLRLLWHVLPATLLFWPVSNVVPSILRTGHDNIFPSALSLVSMWAIRVAAGYVLAFPLRLGLEGLWIAMWLEWAVRSVTLWVRFRRRKWLEKGASA